MSVIRVNKTKDYSVMSNYHLKDNNLSLKAKGLLSVMLSLPDNWKYTVSGLVSICKENETSIILVVFIFVIYGLSEKLWLNVDYNIMITAFSYLIFYNNNGVKKIDK